MSTADLPLDVRIAHHPDQRWLPAVLADLQQWLHDDDPQLSATSSLTGGGAITVLEGEMSHRHHGRPAVMTPSATYGLRVALEVLGCHAGDEVLVPAVDWPASYAAVLSLGARPVPVPVDPATMTIDAQQAARHRTRRTVAVVACHLHGVAADVPELRRSLPGLPVVEDCAGALGSQLDGAPVGTFGEFAVFSFGPGKQIDAGEGGMLLAADQRLAACAVDRTAHPLRLALAGVDGPADPAALTQRPHPLAAVLAVVRLRRWDADRARGLHARAAARLGLRADLQVLGADVRRASAQASVPVLRDPDAPRVGASSGARLLPGTRGGGSPSARQVQLVQA